MTNVRSTTGWSLNTACYAIFTVILIKRNLLLMCTQGAQAVGMGKEAQNVPAAASLYKKANDILG